MYDPTDTIVAISSGAGPAQRGVVRLSGPAARAVAQTVFTPGDAPPLTDTPGYRRRIGHLTLGEVRLPAQAMVFVGPRSYTAQDVVELHTMGNPAVLTRLVETLLSRPMPSGIAGTIRPAQPGEFTLRAFLSGRLDLGQVEGIAAVIASRSGAELRASRALLDGHLQARARQLRTAIIELLADLEAGLDFSEEDLPLITGPQIIDRLTTMMAAITDTLRHATGRADGAAPASAATIVLAGRPNVGKSQLLNRLVGWPRAIVSPQAGTTRDPLATPWGLGGQTVTVVDTAGLDPASGSGVEETAALDRAAQMASLGRIAAADVVVLVFDVAAGWTPADQANLTALADPLAQGRVVMAANKADLVRGLAPGSLPPTALGPLWGLADADLWDSPRGVDALPRGTPPPRVCAVSALTGDGIGELGDAIVACLAGATPAPDAGSPVQTLTARHRAAFTAAGQALSRAADLAGVAASGELLAIELRDAADHIGTIAGRVVSDEILGAIFARFCVGK